LRWGLDRAGRRAAEDVGSLTTPNRSRRDASEQMTDRMDDGHKAPAAASPARMAEPSALSSLDLQLRFCSIGASDSVVHRRLYDTPVFFRCELLMREHYA